MKLECILFDLDDVLFDASLQTSNARLSAMRAMIEAGLPSDIETGYRLLEEIVGKYGPDYEKHFDVLLERLGLRWNPRVIAAGVVAYREASLAYLRPYPDTIPTLLRLREAGMELGITSEGRLVKQWQKLIQLGLQHLFHDVVVCEELGSKSFEPRVFKEAVSRFGTSPERTLFVGKRLNPDIASANEAGLVTARVRRGTLRGEEPKLSREKPSFEIARISDLLTVIDIKSAR
jgi:putative hydrolase of the HAD superfamily